MGGNVTATVKSTGVQTRASKIQVKDIGRQEFIQKFLEIFKTMNKQFKSRYKRPIWADETHLATGFAFNGSTSFIMDPTLPDEEVMKYKPSAGDIDVIIPENLKEDLWVYLDSLEGKDIIPGATYMGSNKPTVSSIGEQINAVFVVDFANGQRCHAQVDFEFLPFENGAPTDWAKFSHSSSFDDARAQIKSVHHKYLIRALVGGASVRDDIVIATSKSTPEKITLSASKTHSVPRMLKFSVGRGIRTAYEPMFDADGKIIMHDGKYVYKEIQGDDNTYETIVANIYKLAFQQLEGHQDDVKRFGSFVGVIELIKKFLNKKQIQNTYDRYVELLWGVKPQRGQELEVDDPELDFSVKNAGYQRLTRELNMKDESEKLARDYYEGYGTRGSRAALNESFRSYLESIQ